MPKLTKRTIDALKPDASSYFVWDSVVVGFGVRVMPSGTKTFQVQYRKGRRTRRSSLGRVGVVALDQARDHAREMLGQVAGGYDPVEEIALARIAPTVADLCDRFLQVHVAVHVKSSTARDYRSTIRRMIRPAIGTFKVSEVMRKDIADLHYRHRATPIQANRMLSVLSKMFNMAEMWGLRPDGTNPCRHVPKYKENRRERFLTQQELRTLGDVLTTCEEERIETPHVVAAFRLLLLTGCRLSEIQTARWEHVTDRGLELPDSKVGKRCVPLPHAAREVLASLPRTSGHPFIIEGKFANAHITDLQHPWRRIRNLAGLHDVRIHDLRHTYASVAVSGGMPIQMVGQLLGHTQLQTTLRYAHLADDPIRAAAEQNSAAIFDSLETAKQERQGHLRVIK
ncbi:tyrosine-type recombinase/integrase [Gymnodinialimonas hymeniacidonis]|uniref:tyrosine-type recombinase/integrase n=1 Tax=Gymnodinialimonas hymeniacidonis TaxID=3126508 RepID=UPI0034C5D847